MQGYFPHFSLFDIHTTAQISYLSTINVIVLGVLDFPAKALGAILSSFAV